jgi:hypothetical protein
MLTFALRTWIRHTRWIPQNVVTLVTMVYFLVNVAWIEVSGGGLHSQDGIVNAVLTIALCAWIEVRSAKLRGLSMLTPDLRDVKRARGVAGLRPIMMVASVPALALFAYSPTISNGLNVASAVFYVGALYTMTIGRPELPSRKERKTIHLRLPRLVPQGSPS